MATDQEKNMATAELITLPATEGQGPGDSCIIAAEDLWKTYDMGSEQQVHALRGVPHVLICSLCSVIPSVMFPGPR